MPTRPTTNVPLQFQPPAAVRVLIVDKSSTARAILRRILDDITTCDVVEADDGHEALARFLDAQFDFVITEWRLAVLDGLSLSKEIRHRNRGIPILMIASNAGRDEILAAIQAGVSDYVIKPFDRALIKQKLARWVSTLALPQS